MFRRNLIFGAASVLAAPAARSQTSGRTYRVGYLGFTATNTPYDDRVWNGFLQRLRELGFVEGRNLVLETRYAEGHNERYADFAAEYVRLNSDVIVAGTGTAIRAVMAASPSVPVVSIGTPDPVRAGFVKSLARPGGQAPGSAICRMFSCPSRSSS